MTLIFGSNGKPLANFVMALASYSSARTPIEYSESPLYLYQHSSIGKLFERLLKDIGSDVSIFEAQVQDFISKYNPVKSGIIRTQLDTFPVYKPHSPTHPDRSAVYKPNLTIKGNKPVEIGYNISSFNQGFDTKWSIPLSMIRVPTEKSSIQIGVSQILTYLKNLDKTNSLVINSADSSYGNAQFISPLNGESNLVNIVRLKNRNVYDYAPKTGTGGANTIYGNLYNLRRKDEKTKRKDPKTKLLVDAKPSVFEKQPDQTDAFIIQTTKGRKIKVELTLFRQMCMRSKKEFSMKHKTFDVLIVDYLDAQTLESIHIKPIYLAICGQRKSELSIKESYQNYDHRYDIEPNNRFIKHQLGLDKFQTPIQKHFDLYLSLIQLTEWLLLMASDEVISTPKKWQKYNEIQQIDGQKLTIAQTRKSCQPFF